MEIDRVDVIILLWYRLPIYFSYTVNMLIIFGCIFQCHRLLTPSFLTVGQGLAALMSWLTAVCVFVYAWLWVGASAPWGGSAGVMLTLTWTGPPTHTHAQKEANRRKQLWHAAWKSPDEKCSNIRRLLCNLILHLPSYKRIYFALICSVCPLKLPLSLFQGAVLS